MRCCSKCGGEKPLGEFAVDASKSSGVKSWCKACDAARSLAYYEANRERVIRRVLARQSAQAAARPPRPPKPCKRCGNLTPSRRRLYCDPCREAIQRARNSRPRPRTNPTARGYGWKHQKKRLQVAAVVDAGRAICSRCAQPIVPGQLWDLDHTDDRSGYAGPAHRSCNRSAGAVMGNRARGAVRRRSRAW
jgi:hypothetical protein